MGKRKKQTIQKTHLEHGDRGYIEDQREFFDKLITQDWQAYSNSHWNKTRQLEVQQILRLTPDCRSVLDVGCGCGYHDLIFAQVATIERILGIDYSTKSIEQANLHYSHSKITRHTADLLKDNELITQSGHFDLVTSFQVIEHLTDPAEFLAACVNYAVHKGYVAVVTPNRLRLVNRVRQWFGRPPGLGDPLHFAEYTVQDLIIIGKQVGLTYIGHFGHSTNLTLKGVTLVGGASSLTVKLGQLFPSWANVIGVVFQKQ